MTQLANARARLRRNPGQWEAFTSAGHCVVIAPPGSGKTELLTARLAQDFVDEIPAPHGAACITYSHAAAGELERRLAQLGVQRRSNLFVGTVHSFAWTQVVRPFGPLVGLGRVVDARVATEAEQDEAFEVARSAVFGEENPFGLRATMDRRRKHATIDAGDPDRFGGERDAALESRYEQELAARGLIDFDDMVRIAVEIVQHHEFARRVLAARFSKLFVDEYQDLGPGLHELVMSLCFDEAASATLFAVADPDQCIYVFSGADPKLVQNLAARSDVLDVRLKRNYRSANEIIRASVRLLPEPIEVEGDHDGGTLRMHQVDGRIEGHAQAVVPILREALEHSRPEALAVICLSNDDCEVVADTVIDQGLPVFVRRKGEYPRTPATAFIESAADWAVTKRGEAGVPLPELLWRWKQLLGTLWDRAREIGFAQVLLDYSDQVDAPAADFVAGILGLGMARALSHDEPRAEDDDAVGQLVEVVSTGVLADITVAQLGERAFARNRIHVLTMHGSKGLEFDLVCAVGLEATRLPRYKAPPWERLQQRRQFYVTVTRARYAVHLFYTGWMINRYGTRYDYGPSPFIRELMR